MVYIRGAGAGGGGKGGPPTFCLKGMDMPVPPLNFWQSLGISTFLPPPQEKIVPEPLVYINCECDYKSCVSSVVCHQSAGHAVESNFKV